MSTKKRYILALDQGTTSSRAIVFDHSGGIKAVAQKEYPQIFRQPGWVEHNPLEIWATQAGVAAEALSNAGVAARDTAGIGITNQRETTLVWDRKSGAPIANAIVWQDRRTTKICEALKKKGLEKTIRQKTGLVIDSYFSAPKLQWLLQNVPGAKAKAKRGELLFGTVDSWLVWNLTRGKKHITDVSNASRTMLFNIRKGDWDDDLLELFGVPRLMLPQVCESSEIYGNAELFTEEIPVAGIAGDQQAALFGQACTRPGMAKNTYGTGCFMLMHTGQSAVPSHHHLLSTIGWTLGQGSAQQTDYMLEGSVFMAGATVQWLRDGLGIIQQSAEIEALAASVADADGVVLVPAFAGLGAPYWDAYARGTIVGMTRGTSKAHIARAALESIAYQTVDVLEAMQLDSTITLRELRVDGGAANNDLLMQFQADMLGVPVERPMVTETTALGAAYLAGLAVGFWSSRQEIAAQWRMERHFEPVMTADQRKTRMELWRRAVRRAQAWLEP